MNNLASMMVVCTLGGVNKTITALSLFQNGLNSVNSRCELVEVSKIGLILHISTIWAFGSSGIFELTPTNVRPSFVIQLPKVFFFY